MARARCEKERSGSMRHDRCRMRSPSKLEGRRGTSHVLRFESPGEKSRVPTLVRIAALLQVGRESLAQPRRRRKKVARGASPDRIARLRRNQYERSIHEASNDAEQERDDDGGVGSGNCGRMRPSTGRARRSWIGFATGVMSLPGARFSIDTTRCCGHGVAATVWLVTPPTSCASGSGLS